MLTRKKGLIVLLGCMTLAIGYPADRAAAVDSRSRTSRTAVPKTGQPAPEPGVPTPKETELGDDHEKNIKALQQEKLDLIRQRVALLNQAFATGQINQRQLDQAMLEELRMQLDFLDQTHMRVMVLEQIVTLLRRAEDEAKDNASSPGKKTSDVSHAASAHGRYVSARIARINAQIGLEKEKLTLKQEREKAKTETQKPTP